MLYCHELAFTLTEMVWIMWFRLIIYTETVLWRKIVNFWSLKVSHCHVKSIEICHLTLFISHKVTICNVKVRELALLVNYSVEYYVHKTCNVINWRSLWLKWCESCDLDWLFMQKLSYDVKLPILVIKSVSLSREIDWNLSFYLVYFTQSDNLWRKSSWTCSFSQLFGRILCT